MVNKSGTSGARVGTVNPIMPNGMRDNGTIHRTASFCAAVSFLLDADE